MYLGGTRAGSVLAAGSRTLTLSFDGREIRQRGGSGPLQLRDVSVQYPDGGRAAYSAAPYTTTAYARGDFQPTGADLTGALSDAGVDTNGDGRYNYLRLSAVLDVTSPGVYTLSADLAGGADLLIASASQAVTLPAGVQTATLDLDGITIGALGFDGPFTVTRLSLVNAAGTTAAFAPSLYATAPYTAGAFEASGAITGTVRDLAGRPISGTVVYAAGLVRVIATTGADGRYALSRLPVGYYRLEAVPQPSDLLQDGDGKVTVYEGQTATLDFTLEAGAGIRGRVTDSAGNPVQAVIDIGWYEPPHYPTDANGYYRADGFEPTEYRVHVSTDPPYNDWWVFVDGRHVDNGAQVSVWVDGGRVTVIDFRRPPAAPVADLFVDKELVQGVVAFDEDVTYRLRVRNLGSLEASGILVTDTLPAGSTFLSEAHPAGFATVTEGSQTVWTAASLPVYGQTGYEALLDVTARLAGSVVAGDLVTNALASSIAFPEGDYNNNAYQDTGTAISPTRDVRVNVWLSSGTPMPGSDIRYGIGIFNGGDNPAPNVRITDTLPVSTPYVSQQSPAGYAVEHIGNQVVWMTPSLPAGAYHSFNVTVHIPDAVPAGTILTNTVEAGTSRPETSYANNAMTRTDTVLARTRDMSVSYGPFSGKPLAGALWSYRIDVQNQGNTAAADVVLTNTLPYSMTYVSSYNDTYFPDHARDLFAPAVDGNVITWSLGTVPPAKFGAFYISARVTDSVPAGAVLTNTTRVSTSHEESDLTDNSSAYAITIASPTCDMNLWHYGSGGIPSPGTRVYYGIGYQNYGNSPCQDVVVTDTIPCPLSVLAWSGTATPTVTGRTMTWDLGTVPGYSDPGYSGALLVTVLVPETTTVGTVLTNTAVITTSTIETGSWTNTGTSVLTVAAPQPGLAVLKSLVSTQIVTGSESAYRIIYRNDADSAAPDTVLTDTLPAGMSFVSAVPLTPTVNGNDLQWDLGTVSNRNFPGAYGTITVSVYLADSVPVGTVLTNTAGITTPYETNNSNNTARHIRDSGRRLARPRGVAGRVRGLLCRRRRRHLPDPLQQHRHRLGPERPDHRHPARGSGLRLPRRPVQPQRPGQHRSLGPGHRAGLFHRRLLGQCVPDRPRGRGAGRRHAPAQHGYHRHQPGGDLLWQQHQRLDKLRLQPEP